MAPSATDASIRARGGLTYGPIYLPAQWADRPGLLAGCTTRTRPAGPWGPEGDWNLKRLGADPALAAANWAALSALVGVPLERMVAPQQVHGDVVVEVGAGEAGLGMVPGSPGVRGADALITRIPGLLLLTGCADCVPVFVYDPRTPAVGLAHAGWKGTVGHIAGRTVAAMVASFGSNPAEMLALIGPSIGPCCYEVGGDVVEQLRDAYPGADEEWQGEAPIISWSRRRAAWRDQQGLPSSEPESDEKPFADLWQANRRALIEAGLDPANVYSEELCTAEATDLFYSHRAEAGRAGRFFAFLGLAGEDG